MPALAKNFLLLHCIAPSKKRKGKLSPGIHGSMWITLFQFLKHTRCQEKKKCNYEVAPHDQSINENDMLYHYFVLLCAQDWKFMRTWLHLFVRLHKQYFNTLASTYLKCKGLSLDNWLDSVQDGCKGDVLSLLGLCLLIEKHILVHLSNGLLWSSLKNSADSHSHDDMLNKVDLHMVYLGRGNSLYYNDVPIHCKLLSHLQIWNQL